MEIYRQYPLEDKVAFVEKLLDRGVLDNGRRANRQPGRCCTTGCQEPAANTLSLPPKAAHAE